MVQQLSTNTFGTAKWIVSPTASDGTHTTIASALTSASSGDTIFIRPGTFTENISLKAGVNLCAYTCDAQTPNVTILGKCSASFNGTASLSGIQLKTNSDNCLAVTGSSDTVIYLVNCYINANNNTAVSYSSSGANSRVWFYSCNGNLATTGIAYFASSGAGTVKIFGGSWENLGGSTTASTVSGGGFELFNCYFSNAVTTSGTTASINFNNSFVPAPIIHNSTSASNTFRECSIDGGTISAISIGAGAALNAYTSTINSSNTNAITGAGTLNYSGLVCSNSSEINTTTTTSTYAQLGSYRAQKQPAFLGYLNATQSNVTGDGTTYTVPFNAELYDQASNFNTGTGTFTAPITGKYQLSTSVLITGGTAMTAIDLYITTTSKNYRTRFNLAAGAAVTNYSPTLSVVASMSAGDTAIVRIATNDSGGKIDDVYGEATDMWTFFSGALIC